MKAGSHYEMVSKILSWNINGVKEKFDNEELTKWFKTFDILIITETHFSIRVKSPKHLIFVGRSKTNQSSAGKTIHGVTIYKNVEKEFQLDIVTDELIDGVVVRLKDSNLIIAGTYIPPMNSTYFSDRSFDNLHMLNDCFHDRQLVILGDPNARISTPKSSKKNNVYSTNPDLIMSTSGRRLTNLYENSDLDIVNGLHYKDKVFESGYTCFRGNCKPQNDLAVTNCMDKVADFQIL